ncbi:zinc finger A20 and AN1 domain-containing stress-associated protein [Musa troglodytarum]|uniref:Zinc finger A20 and AN1 domain-containing stress-associated protein n=1 Tax=Musa troglodytarum TaxID=320322 RepID=A0A9E7KWX2_9LILI|nr:zinc finger A20 and AN1 domain-containing stress-associated protein [Musa troglodytarum]
MEQLEKMGPPLAAAESEAGSRKVAAVLLLPGRGAPEGGGPVRAVQEEGEAVREVRVPVREHVLRGAPPPGDARVRVRLQGAWPRGDRQGQPRRREGQAAEDLKKTQEY